MVKPCGRIKREELLLLFLLRSGGGGLSSLSLGQALLELIDASGSIYEFLLAGIKRMAHVTNTDDDHWLGRACFNYVTTRAADLCIQVFRMYINFHKRPEKIPSGIGMTSRNFGNLQAAKNLADWETSTHRSACIGSDELTGLARCHRKILKSDVASQAELSKNY